MGCGVADRVLLRLAGQRDWLHGIGCSLTPRILQIRDYSVEIVAEICPWIVWAPRAPTGVLANGFPWLCGLAPAENGTTAVSRRPRQKGEEGKRIKQCLDTRYDTFVILTPVHLINRCLRQHRGTSSWPVSSAGRFDGRTRRKRGAVRPAVAEIRPCELWRAPKNVASSFRRFAGKRLVPAVRGWADWIPLGLRIPEDPSHFKFDGTVLEIWKCQ